jgi:hypothetical protein
MNGFKIIGATTIAFITYGILHDQITVRVCIEYFTIGHPPLVPTSNPTLIALAWGFMATWWLGLLMGTFIAMAATLGPWQPLTMRDLMRPGAVLFITAGTIALLAGSIGYFVAKAEIVYLLPAYYDLIPAGKHARFIANLWAHTASYSVGGIGSLILCGWIMRYRRMTNHRKAQVPL